MATSVIYPEGIAPALGHLNSTRNDIEIFVEDTANLNVWRNIIRKFLPSGTVFNDPIPLGGREKVLRECRSDQRDDARRKLYIIDADLDLLNGKAKPKLKHLYRLRAYCIENYLLQEDAFVQVAQVLDPNISEVDARTRLDFSGWKQRNHQPFRDLFLCYAIVNEIDEQHQTVGQWIGHVALPAPADDELCSQKVGCRTRNLIRLVREDHSQEDVRQSYEKVKRNAERLDYFFYVSGKDCILNRLVARVKRNFGQMQDGQLKVLLATHMSPGIDPYLKRRFKSICSN